MRSIVPLAFALVLAGCLGPAAEPKAPAATGPAPEAPLPPDRVPTVPPATTPPEPRGHPWPTEDAWPADLLGPFRLGSLEHAVVAAEDGVPLDGWIYRPDLPAGVLAPVVLWSAPYWGNVYPWQDDPQVRGNDDSSLAVPIDLLVSEGFAVAVFSVRGTGNSGGCFEWFGPNEQRDQATLVEWLGTRPWSNGRVGMVGLSYHGTTPWMAAIENPPHLKTIVTGGIVSDPYVFARSPQGATLVDGLYFTPYFTALASLAPPVLPYVGWGADLQPERSTLGHAEARQGRLCPEVADVLAGDAAGFARGDRGAAFWEARRMIDRYPDVEAAVLLVHGFQDLWRSGHAFQEDAVFDLLRAPKRMIEGQWAHEMPNYNSWNPAWALRDWNETLVDWLSYWLMGRGDVPAGLGTASYQDGTGEWRTTTAWPPANARNEALRLAGATLRAEPGQGAREFLAAPSPGPRARGGEGPLATPLCPEPAGPATFALYATEPLAERVVVAGNPHARLVLEADRPGGLVALHLLDLAPDFRCVDGVPTGARPLTFGAADLRFAFGNYVGRDFPVGKPTAVRIDLANLAEAIEPGHRLALLVGFGDFRDRVGEPYAPTIRVVEGADGSAVVLPLVAGALGGLAPDPAYPPRPFVPT